MEAQLGMHFKVTPHTKRCIILKTWEDHKKDTGERNVDRYKSV